MIYIQQTVAGPVMMRRTVKRGRKPKPEELRRPCRVFGSVPVETRARLDKDVAHGLFSESDILNMALSMWFRYVDNIQLGVE